MKRAISILFVVALSLVMLLSACQSSNAGKTMSSTDASDTQTKPGDDPKTSAPATEPPAPPQSLEEIRNWKFSTVDLDGKPVDESIFRGAKLTMVNVWATWCGPCVAEIPHIAELAKEDFADLGIQVVGIVSDIETGLDNEGTLANAKFILQESGATYLNIQVNYADMFDSLLKYVEGFPTTIFVDSQGNVVGPEILGMRSKEAFLEEANQRLGMLND